MVEAFLLAFTQWLGATALSHAIQAGRGIIPALQTVHILCLAVVFTAVMVVDLRVLRILQRDLAPQAVAQRFLPVVLPLLGVLLVTGSLLIIGEPRRCLLNATFYLKLGLIVLALLLTAALRRSFGGGFAETGTWRQRGAQCLAGLSMICWCGVLFAGRWIAYTQAG